MTAETFLILVMILASIPAMMLVGILVYLYMTTKDQPTYVFRSEKPMEEYNDFMFDDTGFEEVTLPKK